MFFDNRFVAGSSSPISHVDAAGDTRQRRRLGDGREFDVLKNFPTADELRREVSPYATSAEIVELEYFWFLAYDLKA